MVATLLFDRHALGDGLTAHGGWRIIARLERRRESSDTDFFPSFPVDEQPMANSKQARKRARQAEVARQRNISHKTRMRTSIKKVIKSVDEGDLGTAQASLTAAIPVIDSMVNKGLVHRNKAARHKSRLNKRLKALSQAATAG
jgi:small subunit ribosomal protein S20